MDAMVEPWHDRENAGERWRNGSPIPARAALGRDDGEWKVKIRQLTAPAPRGCAVPGG